MRLNVEGSRLSGNYGYNNRLDMVIRNNPNGAPISIATAGNVTLTAAQLLRGIIVRDPAGAARTDTLPTAALLVAAMAQVGEPGVVVGDVIECKIVNGANGIEPITIAVGTGGAFDANQTASSQVINQDHSKILMIRITNVTAASEAYVAYL